MGRAGTSSAPDSTVTNAGCASWAHATLPKNRQADGRFQEALYLAEAEGQTDCYVTLLVKLDRVPEAVAYGLEATFVLDGLMEHETAPRELVHASDALYKVDRSRHYPCLDPILDGTVKPNLVRRPGMRPYQCSHRSTPEPHHHR